LFHSLSVSHAAKSYGIIYADVDNYIVDVQKKLIPLLGNVTVVNARIATPSITQLSSYDALLVYSNYKFFDANALGDTIASYVDRGKGVVVATFSLTKDPSNEYCLTGRFLGTNSNNTYYVINTGIETHTPNLTLLAIDTSNPILKGVKSFNGGTSSFRSEGSWNENANKIAVWSDVVQTPLIGSRVIQGSRRVDLNFFPVSSDVDAGFWVASTDGAKILANSLSWVVNTGNLRN